MKDKGQISMFDMLAEEQEEEQGASEVAAVVEERPTIKKAFSDQQPSGKRKMDNNKINELFGIKESYELPERLMTTLLDKEKREAVFNEFMEYDFDFSHDCLRDYFQDEHAARSALKQDYTPDCICDLISLLMPETDKIIDICSGTGALTIGTGRNVYFQCEEFSKASISVLLFNLAIRGMNALVLQKDVLTKEVKTAFRVQNNGQYSDIEIVEDYEEIKTNVVISNPPYSLKWEPKQDERFAGYPLAPKGAADYAFVLDGLSRLTDNGTAFYILPHGVLFRGKAEGEIRKQLVENNLIDKEYEMKVEEFLREHKGATVDSPQNENPVKGYVEVRCRVVRETEKAYEIEKFYRGYLYRPFNESMYVPKSVCIVANATPCDVFGNVHEDETYTMITHIKYWFYRNHASFIDNAID